MSEAVKDPNQSKYHFFLVADGGGPPVNLSSDDLNQLKQQAYAEIRKAVTGWCHFMIDGQRCLISSPTQLFQLRMPDGSLTEIRDSASPVFDVNGRFNTLTTGEEYGGLASFFRT